MNISTDFDIYPAALKEIFRHCSEVSGKAFPPDDYMVLDTETTGFHHVNDRVLQVGICTVEGRKAIKTSSAVIRVESSVQISPEVSAIHGITRDRVDAEGVDPRDYYTKLYEALTSQQNSEGMFVGHNFVRFDGPFLEVEIARYVQPFKFSPNSVIDTGMIIKASKLARLPDFGQSMRELWMSVAGLKVKGLYYNLGEYCFNRFGLEKYGAKRDMVHDAGYDAWLTHLVLEELRNIVDGAV